MPTMKLDWTDNNGGAYSTRIYRSTSPMNPASLPAPLATVAAGVVTYNDTTVTPGNTYYYRVAAVNGATLAVSAEISQYAGTPLVPGLTLFHFDGANDGTSFPEEGSKVFTRTGVCVTKTGDKKFGTASFYNGDVGSAQSRLAGPSAGHDDFVFGTGAFTVELFVKALVTKTVSDSNGGIIGFGGSSGAAFNIRQGGSNGTLNSVHIGFQGVTSAIITATPVITDGAWHWVVAQRDGSGTWSLYLDGTLAGTSTAVLDHNPTGTSRKMIIGNGAPVFNGTRFIGYIDEVRVTKGLARYSGATIPVPTGPFNYEPF